MLLKKILKNLYGSRKPVWLLPRLIILTVIVGVIALMVFENKLIFFPSRFSDGDHPFSWRLDSGHSVDVEEVLFESADTTRLCGWYYGLSDGKTPRKASHVILYCHGNAGHLANRHQKSASLCGLGVDLFIFDYRGYGKSGGSPDEKGVCMDGRAAWNVLLNRGWRPEQIIIYGKSLGGAVAIDLAKEVDCAALITESTFTSIPEMASVAYPFVPRFLVRTQLNSAAKIDQITCPKLFMHGEKDSAIPAEMGKRLYEKALSPKSLVLFPEGDHNDVFYQPGYLDAWRTFLAAEVGVTPLIPVDPGNTDESGGTP